MGENMEGRHIGESTHGKSCGQLLYRNLGIVWIQVFSLDLPQQIDSTNFCKAITAEIDSQVFDYRLLDRGLARFRLKGFDVSILLEDGPDKLTIAGSIHLEAAVFFNSTISITYRLVISEEAGFCHANRHLNSDDVIMLSGIPLGIDHSYPSNIANKSPWGVTLKVPSFHVFNLHLNMQGVVVEDPLEIRGRNEVCHDVMARYKSFFARLGAKETPGLVDSKFTVIDIWENFSHEGKSNISFDDLSASDIMRHVEELHKSELMGLLTLYPFEWPYRDEKAFQRVCGENIAVDTDDLVLVSDNVGLIIGTYGLRGAESPTDWHGYLMERRSVDHVSWPECLHILEIAVAQRHTINSALYILHDTNLGAWSTTNHKSTIKRNSLLALSVGKTIINLNMVRISRYAAHKLLYKEISRRLGIKEDLETLITALDRVNTAIGNIDSVDEIKRSRIVRIFLAFITIVSILQVLFEESRIPILRELWGEPVSRIVAIDVLTLVGLGVVLLGGAAVTAGSIRLIATVTKKIRTRHHK